MNKVIFIFIFLINSVICGSQTRITIDTAYLSTSIDSAIGYPRGSNKQIVYNAPDVYKLDSLYINNEYNQQFTRDSLKSFTFNNIQNPQTLNLVFQKQTYNLHFIYHFEGDIFTTDSIVQMGDTVRFIWTVNEAYFYDSLFVDSVKSDSINSLTFNNINRNHTIRIVLKLKTFTINASTSVGGTISNVGIVNVNYGSRPTYTIIPSIGYIVDTIFVNGVKINTSLFSYQFDSIKSNQTIRVVYKQAQKPSKPKNVQILVGKNNIVLKYSTPDTIGANYIIKYTARILNTNIADSSTDNYINLDGLIAGRNYTISLIATNDGYLESDTVLFSNIVLVNKYILLTESDNGLITNPTTIDSNASIRITYTPNNGYYLDSLIVNNITYIDSINGFTINNINANYTIRAVFASIHKPTLISTNKSIFKTGDTLTIRGNRIFAIELKSINNKFVQKINRLSTVYAVPGSADSLHSFIIPPNLKNEVYKLKGINSSFNQISNRTFVIRVNNVNYDSLGVIIWGNYHTNFNNIPKSVKNIVQIDYYDRSLAVALQSNGKIVVWGPGVYIDTININNIVEIGIGFSNSIALLSNGTVINIAKYLYPELTDYPYTPLPKNLINIVQISTNYDYSLALNDNGKVYAWLDSSRALNTPNYNFYDKNYIPENLNNVIQISAGDFIPVFLKSDSTVKIGGNLRNTNTFILDNYQNNNIIKISSGDIFYTVYKADSTFIVISQQFPKFTESEKNAFINKKVLDIKAGGNYFITLNLDSTIAAFGRNYIESEDANGNPKVYDLPADSIKPVGLKNVLNIGNKNRNAIAFYRLFIETSKNIGGTISPSLFFKNGDNIRITYQANEGFFIDSIFIDGLLNNDSTQGVSFNNLDKFHTIRIVFKKKSYSILYSSTSNGYIVAPNANFYYDSNYTFKFIPRNGYFVDSIIVNGINFKDSFQSFTFKNLKSNQTIYVIFKQAKKPSKPKILQVLISKTNVFLNYLTPDTIGANFISKYKVLVLNANIKDSTSINSIEINNLIFGQTYNISLIAVNNIGLESDTILLQNIQLRNAYNIITQVVNGNISNAVSLDSGNTVRITYTANVGYTIDSVIVNGMLNNDSIIGYTFRNINSNQQIRVVYKLKTFTITSSAGIGGSISPQGITNINYGLNQTYIISPNAGNGLDSLFIDDVLNKDSITSYTFKNITANHKIRATFKTLCGLLTEAPVIIRTNNTLNSSIDYVNYIWKLDATLIANSNNKSISPTTTGIYTLQGINNAGCSSAVSKKYYYSQTCITPTGRLGNAAFIQGNIINNNNQIFVKWCPDLITQNITIKVLNTQGSIIYEQIIPPNNGIFILNKNLLQDKTFFIQVFSADGALLQTSDLIINQ